MPKPKAYDSTIHSGKVTFYHAQTVLPEELLLVVCASESNTSSRYCARLSRYYTALDKGARGQLLGLGLHPADVRTKG